ncbi:EF-P beta-lysylation protein EpmB [Steroidobacter sp. S1-65]|uniref:L-lysine 2,3-aminomutase n=1 Tax=Steroidobacter gossypii TaxID=2805490 RepID=A0ABS1X198_9GAMM|nr:EF-P beta-lysylation protein EpmB [Steroidobacter gossypii]MBM0107019.1 EF-P beta-lysylation protein EpmB [Steroidobacter gossypii]
MIAATLHADQLIPQFDATSLDSPAQTVPHEPGWQQLLADAVTDPRELCTLLELDPDLVLPAIAAAKDFALRVPRSYVARMRKRDPNDPLLLQVLPIAAELQVTEGFVSDPVGDMNRRAAQGLLHKYQGRALLVATGACAVHCRYCFRRHFPYAEESALQQGWQPALEHLRADPTISEVILSGGDPWSLSDRRLKQLTDGLQSIPHIRRLRIHTRYPIVLPERVDLGLLEWLHGVPLQKVVVIHANHAREIDEAVRQACRRLTGAGVTLLNQGVLLAGINDSVAALVELSEALFETHVLPYYLHVLDKVQGAAHFDLPEARALELHRELTARLPGYLVPKLVREVAGAPSKTAVVGAVD